jgi:hypothetical protein
MQSTHQAFPTEECAISAMEKIFRTCNLLGEIQKLMHSESCQRDLWKDTMFAGLYISPILGELLRVRSSDYEGHNGRYIWEYFRLAAIIYVNNLRLLFGIDSLTGVPLYAGKIISLLDSSLQHVIPRNVYVWGLVVAFTSSSLEPQMSLLHRFLSNFLQQSFISNYEELSSVLQEVVWSEELLHPQSEALRCLYYPGNI